MPSASFEVDFTKIYELAKKAGEQDVLESDLYFFKKFLDSNYELKMFLEDLSILGQNRKQLLRETFSAKSKIFWEIISLLIDRDNVYLVTYISERYTRYLASIENIDFAELILSREISKEDLATIKAKFGKNISFKITINPSILGGFVIRKIDGTIIDGSLSGRLEELKRGIKK